MRQLAWVACFLLVALLGAGAQPASNSTRSPPSPAPSPPRPLSATNLSSSSYTVCLAGTRHRPSAISESGDCALLSQALVNNNVNWQQFTCSSQPPSLATEGVESPNPIFYTCWSTPSLAQYSRLVINLWYATQPVVKARMETAIQENYDSATPPGTTRPTPALWSLFSTRTNNLPAGSSAAVGSWYLLYSPAQMSLNPPPPVRTSYPPPAPPPPSPPIGTRASDERCIRTGGGYLLLVDGLELCVRPPLRQLVRQPPGTPCAANFTFTNIGFTGIPQAGVHSNLRLWLDGVEFAGLPNGTARRQHLFETTAGPGAAQSIILSRVGTSTPPRGRFVLSIPIVCPPPSLSLPQRLTLLSGTLGREARTSPCSGSSLLARRGNSTQCYSIPQRTDPAPASLGRMDTQWEFNGACYGTVIYSVRNTGNNTLHGVLGPLTVNFEAAGVKLINPSQGVNVTIAYGAPNSTYFNITDFGGVMEPGQESTFSLPVWCERGCPCPDSSYIIFGAPPPSVCSVEGMSELVGVDTGSSFDDGCCVDPTVGLVHPQTIIADYQVFPGLEITVPLTNVYTTYASDGGTGLPPMRGYLDWDTWVAQGGDGVWDALITDGDYVEGSRKNISTTMINQGIIRATIYSYNFAICGMDLWTRDIAQIVAGVALPYVQGEEPFTRVGCTPDNNYPPRGQSGVYNATTVAALPGTFAGWFSGYEYEAQSVSALQLAWISCRE